MSLDARALALVTGASSGIGAAFARAYARKGFDLALVARNPERLNQAAEALRREFKIDALTIAVDLAEVGAEAKVMAGLAGRAPFALVNNAGFGIPKTFVTVPWSLQREFLMSMAVAPCALAYAVLPAMIASGEGAIINVASIAGFSPGVAGNTLYPGVKSLMIKFSQALDLEVRDKGIRVTALCPGPTRTEFMQRAGLGEASGRRPSPFAQTAEAVVAAALSGNARGRAVVVPGLSNQMASFLLRRLPESLVRWAVNAGASRFLVED